MFKLPTRSDRVYRGKYPFRVHSWSYSGSPAQVAMADFLGINRCVHFELNDGSRYIADMSELKGSEVRLGVEMFNALVHQPTVVIPLTQERYDKMIAIVRALRELV